MFKKANCLRKETEMLVRDELKRVMQNKHLKGEKLY